MESLRSSILSIKAEFTEAKESGDLATARTLASQVDKAIETYNVLVKQNNQLIRLRSELDLAFNKSD